MASYILDLFLTNDKRQRSTLGYVILISMQNKNNSNLIITVGILNCRI